VHDYCRDCTNKLKGSWNERKQRSVIPIMFCIALTVTGLWFPSWHMYIVIACAFYLAALVVIFLLIIILLVLVFCAHSLYDERKN
jgi:hypothetical protein